MSEQEVMNIDSELDSAEEQKPTLGEWLVAARTAKGLSAQDVASVTNRPMRQIIAVEADDYESLSAPTLLRAVVRHYVKAIGADEKTALAHLPEAYQTVQIINPHSNVHVKPPFTNQGTPLKTPWIARKWLVAVLVAVILFMLYSVFISRFMSRDTVSKVSEPNQVQVLTSPEIVHAESVESVVAEVAPVTTVSDSIVPEVVVAKSLPATLTGDLVLKFKAGSWVEIKDADDLLLLTGMQTENTEQAVSGNLPLKVKIGNANQVEVIWKGAPYDLEPVTKGGVARFSVE